MVDEAAAKNVMVVLGPTASGKTSLGVALARYHGGEIVSADSRQVYRGLNIGAGKDLDEYRSDGRFVPYHLIDVADLGTEYSVFRYQRDFFEVFEALGKRGVLPVVVGGTGLYLEAVLQGYALVEAPENRALRKELGEAPLDVLVERLIGLRGDLHNVTDTEDRGRLIRAIEIAEYSVDHSPEPTPEVRAVVLGIRWDRAVLHKRIADRLKERLESGLVEEVRALLEKGVAEERLRSLGLEYRFVTDYVEGAIKNKNDLFQKLNGAIRKFAKRQETWFRRMERRGAPIRWIDRADFEAALEVTKEHFDPCNKAG